ncbi:hypothetical protein J4418_04745 [Candidatus Woesearchaeota archaeon]|nr:hypothetical protein [Candidatus Woesearchaeota archaeon]
MDDLEIKTRFYSNEMTIEIINKSIKKGLSSNPMFVYHALYALKNYIQPKLRMMAKLKADRYEKDWSTYIDIAFLMYKLNEYDKIN